MARRTHRDAPGEYTPDQRAGLAALLASGLRSYVGGDVPWSALAGADDDRAPLPGWPLNAPVPRSMRITAEISWDGYFNAQKFRTVVLAGLDRTDMRAMLRRLAQVQRIRRPRPYSTYTARGWRAQWRKISRVRGGAEALAAAGLDATDRTRRNWAAGRAAPSKTNQARIAAAYAWLRDAPLRAAADYQPRRDAALVRLADAQIQLVQNREGARVLFLNVAAVEFGE